MGAEAGEGRGGGGGGGREEVGFKPLILKACVQAGSPSAKRCVHATASD